MDSKVLRFERRPFVREKHGGPTLKTLDFTIHIGRTPTFLYFDFALNTACVAHCVGPRLYSTSQTLVNQLKLRLHTAINRADFISWCML